MIPSHIKTLSSPFQPHSVTQGKLKIGQYKNPFIFVQKSVGQVRDMLTLFWPESESQGMHILTQNY